MESQATIVARMERWAAYRWTPPAEAPRRDPRLASLFDPCREALAAATEETWSAVGTAVTADWDVAFLEAVRLGEAGGRTGDVRAARWLNRYEGFDEWGGEDPARRAAHAIFLAVMLRDLLPVELFDRLTAPWCAGFGVVPGAADLE